jgi:hypothetical protein
VVCDWVQYRNNFRDVVEIRPILHVADGSEATPGTDAALGGDVEIAVDVRRAPNSVLSEVTASLLRHEADRVFLKDWTAGKSGL